MISGNNLIHVCTDDSCTLLTLLSKRSFGDTKVDKIYDYTNFDIPKLKKVTNTQILTYSKIVSAYFPHIALGMTFTNTVPTTDFY